MKLFNTLLSNFKDKLFAKLGIQIFSFVFVGVILLFLYLAHRVVLAEDKAKQITANMTSANVLDKADRNFYERFGDVQAFAANDLVIQQLVQPDSVNNINLQSFINTMTHYYILYDLMMIVDINGKVIMTNTFDKNQAPINAQFLIGKDFSNEEWFRVAVSANGPDGGAWFSDFIQNDEVANIYKNNGFGMIFSAPIKDASGKILGVWYNFANWSDVTQGIRKAAEQTLHESNPDATILLTNKEGSIIESEDGKLINKNIIINELLTNKTNTELAFQGHKIIFDEQICGWANSKGAYTYKGKGWKALTLIPKSTITLSTFFNIDMLLAIFTTISFIGFFGYYFYRQITSLVINKTLYLKDILNEFSNGNLPQIDTKLKTNDEIGEIVGAVATVSENLTNLVVLSDNVGNGKYDSDIIVFNNQGILGSSLARMRENLKLLSEEDKKRNWANTGMAQIGEILRSNLENPEILYDNIIKFIVKYTNVNQGGIFIKNEFNHKILDLASCYAYDKKKFVEKSFELGDGLAGQCAQEGNTIYITEIPQNFAEIRSGLGGASPSAVLLIPLKVNLEILGVIEVASFTILESYQIEFLEKIADSVAATISSVKINARTKELLEMSRQQTEEMRSTEEEMRQNLEEMSATQEEMERKTQHFETTIADLQNENRLLNEKLVELGVQKN